MAFIRRRLPVILLAFIAMSPAARAQFAVIDVAAVTQLVTEVQNLEQSLAVARDHLAEAQAQLRSMTGGRGMERLLAGTDRNYLPGNWAQLSGALDDTGSAYTALSTTVQQALTADAVLTQQQLSTLSPDARQQLTGDRRTVALLQAVSRRALANASSRFTDLQQLIDAVGAASDQKAILDLNARIGAEQVMLENEQAKLAMLVAVAEAERWADDEQGSERAIAAQGEFVTRFQPTP